MNNQQKISLLFLVFVLNVVNCEKTCLLKGKCDDTGYGPVPCVESSYPSEFTGDDLTTYKELCPNLAKNYGLTCCDIDQLESLNTSMQIVNTFDDKTCVDNFRMLLCNLACSPYQSKFMNILEKSLAEKTYLVSKVDKASIAIDLKDMDRLFESCKTAFSKDLKTSFLKLFGDSKNSLSLFYIMGKLAPFTYEFHVNNGGLSFALKELPNPKHPLNIDFD